MEHVNRIIYEEIQCTSMKKYIKINKLIVRNLFSSYENCVKCYRLWNFCLMSIRFTEPIECRIVNLLYVKHYRIYNQWNNWTQIILHSKINKKKINLNEIKTAYENYWQISESKNIGGSAHNKSKIQFGVHLKKDSIFWSCAAFLNSGEFNFNSYSIYIWWNRDSKKKTIQQLFQ